MWGWPREVELPIWIGSPLNGDRAVGVGDICLAPWLLLPSRVRPRAAMDAKPANFLAKPILALIGEIGRPNPASSAR